MLLTNEELLDKLGIEYNRQHIKSVSIKIEPDSLPTVSIEKYVSKQTQKIKPREVSFKLYNQAARSFMSKTKDRVFDFDNSKFQLLSAESAFTSDDDLCLVVHAHRIFDN